MTTKRSRMGRWLAGFTVGVGLVGIAGGPATSSALRLQDQALATTGVQPTSADTATASGSTSVTFSTSNLNSAIPDGGTSFSGITVPDTGFGTVLDVNVSVRLAHPIVHDIDVSLVSPDGTVVRVASDLRGDAIGAGSTNCSGAAATFDDEAAVYVDAAAPPYVGAIRPERRLAAFDGGGAVGLWTLRLTDGHADKLSGTLYCWSVTFRRAAAPGDIFLWPDGQADLAVWRPSIAQLFTRPVSGSGQGVVPLGASGDIPVPADYEGQGYENPHALFRPSTGRWSFLGPQALESPLANDVIFGINGDVPVPGDYNGDGFADIAVWRPSDGVWYLRSVTNITWGTSGDIPVPADYNGDGTTDLAVWRPSEGVWYVRNIKTVVWGIAGDIPVPADYDGDGKADVAIFRPSNGTWYILSADAQQINVIPWGTNGDIPIPADFDGDGRADLAVFRGSDGGWYLRNIGVIAFGITGDIPLTKRPSYPGYPF